MIGWFKDFADEKQLRDLLKLGRNEDEEIIRDGLIIFMILREFFMNLFVIMIIN